MFKTAILNLLIDGYSNEENSHYNEENFTCIDETSISS